MTAPVLMVQGTASSVGKSFLVTALCRAAARRGLRVVPFKGSNMSNNADVTADGREIGRAQSLQARAAGVEPDPRMNPVLVKPLADTRSEVVLLGRRDTELTRTPWRERAPRLWPIVERCLAELREEADLVIAEGAGSPAEINLRDIDLANAWVARAAEATVLLVTDVDLGGAFAALLGTWAMMDPADRRRIDGFVLNRFRGDPALLSPAPETLERRTGMRWLGTVPLVRHRLPREDAASLEPEWEGEGELRVTAVRLPHVANFDDLDPLAAEPGVAVRWAERPVRFEESDAYVVPGTRNTMEDLAWLWETGWAAALRAAASCGRPVLGLCGGYQMLGTAVADPTGVERRGEAPGLGLLEAATELAAEKTTRRTAAEVVAVSGPFSALRGARVTGYEIHHGRTRPGSGSTVWLRGPVGPLGCGSGSVWGTYLHGALADDRVRAAWLAAAGHARNPVAWAERIEREIDRVADVVEAAVHVDALFARAGLR